MSHVGVRLIPLGHIAYGMPFVKSKENKFWNLFLAGIHIDKNESIINKTIKFPSKFSEQGGYKLQGKRRKKMFPVHSLYQCLLQKVVRFKTNNEWTGSPLNRMHLVTSNTGQCSLRMEYVFKCTSIRCRVHYWHSLQGIWALKEVRRAVDSLSWSVWKSWAH